MSKDSQKKKNPDRESPWIEKKKTQLKYLQKLKVPENRIEFMKALVEYCTTIEESFMGWSQWLNNWPIMEKFHTKDLRALKEEFRSSAIKILKLEIDIALKMYKARLELIKRLNPSTRAGYAETMLILHKTRESIIKLWTARFSNLTNISSFSEEDLLQFYRNLKRLAIEIVKADIKATRLGAKRFEAFEKKEKGLVESSLLLKQKPERKPQIYIS